MPVKSSGSALKKELRQLKKPSEKLDATFIRWYLDVRISPNEDDVTIVDGPGDGGIDAIVRPKGPDSRVVLVQSFYTDPAAQKGIPAKKLREFVELADIFASEESFDFWVKKVRSDLQSTYKKIYRANSAGSKKIEWLFITTAKHSTTSKTMGDRARRRFGSFLVADRSDVFRAFNLYLEGAAPPDEPLIFQYEGERLRVNDCGCPMSIYAARVDDIIRYVQKDEHRRLFSRNVRLAVQKSKINEQIVETFENEPDEFLLCHNGLTIICEGSTTSGNAKVTLEQPSVVNGAQTLLSLAESRVKNTGALIPARVIDVGDYASNSQLVRHIVLRSNTQNAISPPDLVACDSEQVELERYFRSKGRTYIRRRGQEVLTPIGPRAGKKVNSKKLATVLASCDPKIGIVAAAKNINALFEGASYDALFVKPTGGEVLAKYRLHELLEDARKTIKDEQTKKRSKTAWRNVLSFAWAAIASDKNLRRKITRRPEILLEFDIKDPVAREFLKTARAAYVYAWSQYTTKRRKEPDLSPTQFFFGSEERTKHLAAIIGRKYTKKLRRELVQAIDG